MSARTLLLLLLVAAAWWPLQGLAADRLATVNYQKILKQAPQIEAARKQMKKEFSPLKKQLEQRNKHVKALFDAYRDMTPGTNSLHRASVSEKYQTASKKLSHAAKKYRTRLHLRMAQLRANFKKTVGRAVSHYASRHGFTVVVKNSAAYAAAAPDITDEVLDLLGKAYRKAQAESGNGNAQP